MSKSNLTRKKITVKGRKGTYQRSVMVRAEKPKSLARRMLHLGFKQGVAGGVGGYAGMRLGHKLAGRAGLGLGAQAGGFAGSLAMGLHHTRKVDKTLNQDYARASFGQRLKGAAAGGAGAFAGGVLGFAGSHAARIAASVAYHNSRTVYHNSRTAYHKTRGAMWRAVARPH